MVETIDGHRHLDLNIVESMVASYEAFPTPSFEAPQMPSQADNFEFFRPF